MKHLGGERATAFSTERHFPPEGSNYPPTFQLHTRFIGSCRKVLDDAEKSLCRELNIKPGDETHNEAAQKRNEKDIRLAKALIEKYRIKT